MSVCAYFDCGAGDNYINAKNIPSIDRYDTYFNDKVDD